MKNHKKLIKQKRNQQYIEDNLTPKEFLIEVISPDFNYFIDGIVLTIPGKDKEFVTLQLSENPELMDLLDIHESFIGEPFRLTENNIEFPH